MVPSLELIIYNLQNNIQGNPRGWHKLLHSNPIPDMGSTVKVTDVKD